MYEVSGVRITVDAVLQFCTEHLARSHCLPLVIFLVLLPSTEFKQCNTYRVLCIPYTVAGSLTAMSLNAFLRVLTRGGKNRLNGSWFRLL